MDLVDADNEVVAIDDEDIMVADDEKVLCVSNNWFDAGADSSTVR
jgi:hypothetical protein